MTKAISGVPGQDLLKLTPQPSKLTNKRIKLTMRSEDWFQLAMQLVFFLRDTASFSTRRPFSSQISVDSSCAALR